jgi:hypothetical protein
LIPAATKANPRRTIRRPSSEFAFDDSVLVRVYGRNTDLFVDRYVVLKNEFQHCIRQQKTKKKFQIHFKGRMKLNY